MYLTATPKLAQLLCTFSDEELDKMWAHMSEMRDVLQALADDKCVEERNPLTNKWELTKNPTLIGPAYSRVAKTRKKRNKQ